MAQYLAANQKMGKNEGSEDGTSPSPTTQNQSPSKLKTITELSSPDPTIGSHLKYTQPRFDLQKPLFINQLKDDCMDSLVIEASTTRVEEAKA